MISHHAPISGVAIFEDKFIATAGYDDQIILWDAATKKALQRGWHDHLANHCDFSPDGKLLVSASSDGSARVWVIPELKLLYILTAHKDDVMQAKFSPDGKKIATCSYDSTLAVFSVDGDLKYILEGHHGLIESFDWSIDSNYIYSCGTDGTIRTWNSENGQCVEVKEMHGYDMDAILVIADSTFLVGNNEGELQIIVNGEVENQVKAHNSSVKNVIKNRESNLILSLGYDGAAILWKFNANNLSLEEIKKTDYPNEIWARSAKFKNNDKIIFATFGSKFAEWDISVNKWDLTDYEPSKSLNSIVVDKRDLYTIGDSGELKKNGTLLSSQNSLANFICKHKDVIISGGQTGEIYNHKLGRSLYKHNSPLNCSVSYSVGKQAYFAVGTYSGDVIILEINNDEVDFVKIVPCHENAIKGMAVQKNMIYTGSADGEICILNKTDFAIINKIVNAHEGILNDLCSYYEGVATVSRDLNLKLWGEEQKVFKSRHKNSIKCVASNPEGTLIATGSYGGTVDIFDATNETWIGDIVKISDTGVPSLAWNNAEQCFFCVTYDGNVHKVIV